MPGGRDSLPDFKVTPFILPSEVEELDNAISSFLDEAVPAFNKSNQDAQDVVKLTNAWVGVGERVVDLLKTVAENRAQTAEGDRAGGLQKLLGQLASMKDMYGTMKGLLT